MPDEFLSNYGMMIPQGPYREPKKSDSKKWLCRLIGHRWQIYMITTWGPMPHQCKRCKKITDKQWPFLLQKALWKYADFVLRPLCFLGWHRWKGTYKFSSFTIGGTKEEKHEEDNYQCARCNKNKTIKLY